MVKKDPPDERVVYLACKSIFRGDAAQVRRVKVIEKILQKHSQIVQPLVSEHGLEHVCNTAQSLLSQDVFTSTLKAKIKFPELFEVSPAQSADRAASETEAARADTYTLREAAGGRKDELEREVSELSIEDAEANGKQAAVVRCALNPFADTIVQCRRPIPDRTR